MSPITQIEAIIATKLGDNDHLPSLDAEEFTSLVKRYRTIQNQIKDLDSQWKSLHGRLSTLKLRVSVISDGLETPDRQDAAPSRNPRIVVSSYFVLRYSNKRRTRDVNAIRSLELELQKREDKILSLRRQEAIAHTEITDYHRWMVRHEESNGCVDCPFPFPSLSRPKFVNRQYYENKSFRYRQRHSRTSSMSGNISHPSEQIPMECPICAQDSGQTDTWNVGARFSKLKVDNFALRLRRSYSASDIAITRRFMEISADRSTGIYGDMQLPVSRNINSEVTYSGSTGSETMIYEELYHNGNNPSSPSFSTMDMLDLGEPMLGLNDI